MPNLVKTKPINKVKKAKYNLRNVPEDITQYGIAYRKIFSDILQSNSIEFICETFQHVIKQGAMAGAIFNNRNFKNFPSFVFNIHELENDLKLFAAGKSIETDWADEKEFNKNSYSIQTITMEFINNAMDWGGGQAYMKCLLDLSLPLSSRHSYVDYKKMKGGINVDI
jgi:hypothetical protein